jgi:hypothetical protein
LHWRCFLQEQRRYIKLACRKSLLQVSVHFN